MIASVLIGKLCVIAAVAAVALVLEVVVPILRQRQLERILAEDSADIAPVGTENEVKAKGEGEDRRSEKAKANKGDSTSTVCLGPSSWPSSANCKLPTANYQLSPDAERIWTEARAMKPSAIPDFSTDWQYMSLLHKAAELGHVEAMSLLGDHAVERGDLVEAFYWKLGVELCGGVCRNPSLADIVREWTAFGCPDGSEEIGAGFTERQGAFAHAVLCLRSGVDPQYARIRLKELAEQGCVEAQLFLRR